MRLKARRFILGLYPHTAMGPDKGIFRQLWARQACPEGLGIDINWYLTPIFQRHCDD